MPRLTRGRDKKINFPKDLEEVYPASLCESIEQTLSQRSNNVSYNWRNTAAAETSQNVNVTEAQRILCTEEGEDRVIIETANSGELVWLRSLPHLKTRAERHKGDPGKRRNLYELKNVISNQKVANLVTNFANKLKRNNMLSAAVEFEQFEDNDSETFLNSEGLQLNELFDKLLAFLGVILLVLLLFVFTLELVFQGSFNLNMVTIVEALSLPYYVLDIALNFILIKSFSGRKLTKLKEIGLHYLTKFFAVDSACVLILLLDLAISSSLLQVLRLIFIAKIPQCMDKIEKLQVYFIENYYKEQYWSLVKVFIFNFCFAHVLAVFLIAMTSLSAEQNWMVAHGIGQGLWYEKYIWAYYWGTTIMLTVGFGDIVATTYQEALCLVLIMTISCVALAYNINCVGTLISNIRAQDIEKSKNYKTFKKLAEKSALPEELSWRINNFIEESVNIKKKFNIEEENCFVNKLPTGFKKEFLKESNKAIFQNIIFFSSLVEKTLYALAEKIQMHIAHPEEILQPVDDDYNLLILKGGEVGYMCHKMNSCLNDQVVNRIKRAEKDNPFLINLHFITKQRPNFEVKSLVYSIIYFLDYDKLIAILKDTQLDFEMYSFLKDKNKNVVDEFEVIPCEHCTTRHTKFSCHRLHYIPLEQHLITKNLVLEKKAKNKRNPNIPRISSHRYSTLLKFQGSRIGATLAEMNSLQQNRDSPPLINEKFLLDGFKRVEELQPSPAEWEIGIQKQLKLLSNTTQMIKEELNKAFRMSNEEDEVWLICSDRMKNYKGYFASDNSCNLEEKFKASIRLQRQRASNLAAVDLAAVSIDAADNKLILARRNRQKQCVKSFSDELQSQDSNT